MGLTAHTLTLHSIVPPLSVSRHKPLHFSSSTRDREFMPAHGDNQTVTVEVIVFGGFLCCVVVSPLFGVCEVGRGEVCMCGGRIEDSH